MDYVTFDAMFNYTGVLIAFAMLLYSIFRKK